MPSARIPKGYDDGTYFLTFTVKNWYYIFDRHNRFHILADSIKHCQAAKGLKLYAYVFMLNHMHLMASAPDMAAFIRDFKKFTSKEIQKNIIATEPGALKLFSEGNGKYGIWAPGNMPKPCESREFALQKISYIHSNPVRKQYIRDPEDWIWSSANPESTIKTEPLL